MNEKMIKVSTKRETNDCQQDSSEIQFSIQNILLSKQLHDKIKLLNQSYTPKIQKDLFEFKIQVICKETQNILKEILAKTSINQNQSNQTNLLFQIPESHKTCFKAIYLNNMKSTVVFKINVKQIEKGPENNPKDQKTDNFEFIGQAEMDLAKIKMKQRQKLKEFVFANIKLQPFVQSVPITNPSDFTGTQNKERNLYSFYQRKQHGEAQFSQYQRQYMPRENQYIPNKGPNSYINLKIFQTQNIPQLIQLYRIRLFQSGIYQRRQINYNDLKINRERKTLQIVSKVVNNKIVSCQFQSQNFQRQRKSSFQEIQNSLNYLKNYPQETRDNYERHNFNRKKPYYQQETLPSQSPYDHFVQRQNFIGKNRQKTFRQKISELLHEVKETKKQFNALNKRSVYSSKQIIAKNPALNQKLMSHSKSHQINPTYNQSQSQSVYQSYQCNVINSIMPITTFKSIKPDPPTIRHSKSEILFTQNQNYKCTDQQKYQDLYRIQKRLESHQKIVHFSNQFLHKMYLNPE